MCWSRLEKCIFVFLTLILTILFWTLLSFSTILFFFDRRWCRCFVECLEHTSVANFIDDPTSKAAQSQWQSFLSRWQPERSTKWYVKSVFIIHVGGTRCVTSSTANIMKIHARITLTVEFIRTCIFLCLFYV